MDINEKCNILSKFLQNVMNFYLNLNIVWFSKSHRIYNPITMLSAKHSIWNLATIQQSDNNE